jgi:hypothetical protein
VAIRHRQMRPNDVRKCVDIVAAHPIVGSRYGSAITDLPPAWLSLLGRDAFNAVVFEELRGSSVRILTASVTAFVSDDFMREAKTPPLFWIGPELARRVVRSDSPLLSDKELQEANSSAGLNLVVWQVGMLPQQVEHPELTGEGMNAFISLHRGFLLKELMVQPETAEHLLGLCNSGGLLLNAADGSYGEFRVGEARHFLTEPCIIGGTRYRLLTQIGSWAFPLFAYQPPLCGFNRSEQRLLLIALDGGTDEELADALQISLSAVKKMWRSIYARVGVCLPELLPHSVTDVEASERGKEKKQRLLTYLRDHPEELRPVSRRLLKQKHGRASMRSA